MSDKPETRSIPLGGVAVVPSERMRKLRPQIVDRLALSMNEVDLLNPVTVTPGKSIGFRLLGGWHRLEAAKKLGWAAVECRIFTGLSADHIRLAEIEENLLRAELSTAERLLHLKEHKRIYEMLHPETKHGGAKGAGRGKGKLQSHQNGDSANQRFSKKAAEESGKSE